MKYKKLPYNQSLMLLTDFYELTMAYGYWKNNMHEKEAVFHLNYRKNPFEGGFAICCGLGYIIDILNNLKFDDLDLKYLASLKDEKGNQIFEDKFLSFIKSMSFNCDVYAIPEGTVVFPHEPLIRVQGPIIQAQILETILLNIINFQTLIATKAARVFIAASGDPVIEFGPRRAQGIDGALAASRAAYIGGCESTSNVLTGKIFGIPVKGTHAHSWVMAFDTELDSFKAYGKAFPENSIFLVDTYHTLEGIKNAIEAGKELKKEGYNLAGIRLDSGDLAYLSKEARKLLDENGFKDAKIVASNNLDENIIKSLKEQGSKIDIWGVGTKLSTGAKDATLDGVYKLSAIKDNGWKYKIKISERITNISNPGILQVRRYYAEKENIADVIYNEGTDLENGCTIVDPFDITRQKQIEKNTKYRDLLIPIFKKGKQVYKEPGIKEIRQSTIENLNRFHEGIKRFVNPHQYPVGIEQSLNELKTKLIFEHKGVR